MNLDPRYPGYGDHRLQRRESRKSTYFTVRVGAQIVGLPVDEVRTVFHPEKLTPVPLAPPEIAGLANLRGRIVTVLHLDRCLRIESDETNAKPIAVGIVHNGEDYAFLVDDAGDVVYSEEADRIDCPGHVDAHFTMLVSDCYRRCEGFLPIVDVARLIAEVSRQSELKNRAVISGNSARGAHL
ncbi:chemotaxis protein CheW [Methylocystis heyeri]|uniref:Chemotaxis protein CheW n=1 Tax=Methylocystis heyeri TaxID=391905 RepID=A0A6B8KLM7_9HYPH|nr:chemotaxis protein CheW [Methylocystis heyeri]QGM47810.1 chemotaxis protein CheW [Methylocystis heyeri]